MIFPNISKQAADFTADLGEPRYSRRLSDKILAAFTPTPVVDPLCRPGNAVYSPSSPGGAGLPAERSRRRDDPRNLIRIMPA